MPDLPSLNLMHGSPMKNPARSLFIAPPSPERAWFRDLLWMAFPGRSATQVAFDAARALGVSQRQVLHWLACEQQPKLGQIAAVMLLVGVEVACRKLEGRR